MRHYRLKVAAALLGIAGFFLALGIAGDIDYTEQVILHMTFEEYDRVKDTLTHQYGHAPTESEIAHWWAEHHGSEE